MTATLPPNGPLNLDAGLQRSHFQNQETQDSNPLYSTAATARLRMLDSSLLAPQTPLLRRLYLQDGVLWVKGLLDPDLVNDFRAAYLLMMNYGTGMLKPVSDPCGGIFNPDTDWRDFTLPGALRVAAGLPDTGPFVENAIQFKDAVGRRIEPFIGSVLGFEESWCLPRSLLRCAVPGGEITPVHYDQIFLRAGPLTSVTAWVPIGDIEVESGGLIYLDRAHDIGVKYEEDFSKMNADLSDEERMFGNKWSRAWLAGAYEAGDVVFHTPYTIHAGAKNRSPKGRVRVSTDLRFVDKTKPYDERWTFLAYSKNDPNVARKTALRKQA
ncbi:hypothetical protein NCS56_01195000 [Fusarium sp. Ph1]|nr:hypothetical protein NCS56_01195000 [Fusarium sp. Ph1]